ncbi:response regulator [Marinimicrobium sp. ARAG 43.8]|uniref:response regulator n=1 Tax=Marinimicrobium sp. ARAG 43.8 TaxID=3418719 RepID=UPI003CEDB743
MATPLLICDDSLVARKQMLRALPPDWDVVVSFASDGEECLHRLEQGDGDILILDLNMPNLDGYAVLQAIKERQASTIVIVVSGDIQPEAERRVLALGAMRMMTKPVDPAALRLMLMEFGLYHPSETNRLTLNARDIIPGTTWQEVLQEQSNIAMGQAGDLLARLLGVFVELSVPRVDELSAGELSMALAAGSQEHTWSGVCQGFIGGGLAGEVLLLFADSSIDDMSRLLGYTNEETDHRELEVLMDLSGILAGAFLKGLGEQLNLSPRITTPVVLGTHVTADNLMQRSHTRGPTLTIEVSFAIEGYSIVGNLLLLFTEDSLPRLKEILEYLRPEVEEAV